MRSVIGAEEEEEEIASRQEDGGSTHSLRKSGVAMVYVNNQLVLRNATLREGDKLRIGQTHVFQLNVPQTKEEVASKEPVDTITSIVGDITTEGTSDRLNATEFASQLRRESARRGRKECSGELSELQPLIDEANVITEELRGDENFDFTFTPHVLCTVTHNEFGPELAVGLCRSKKADDIDEYGKPVYDDDGPQTSLDSVWSQKVFMTRLEAMRDLHEAVSDRDTAWGEKGDADPWGDIEGVPMVGVVTKYYENDEKDFCQSVKDNSDDEIIRVDKPVSMSKDEMNKLRESFREAAEKYREELAEKMQIEIGLVQSQLESRDEILITKEQQLNVQSLQLSAKDALLKEKNKELEDLRSEVERLSQAVMRRNSSDDLDALGAGRDFREFLGSDQASRDLAGSRTDSTILDSSTQESVPAAGSRVLRTGVRHHPRGFTIPSNCMEYGRPVQVHGVYCGRGRTDGHDTIRRVHASSQSPSAFTRYGSCDESAMRPLLIHSPVAAMRTPRATTRRLASPGRALVANKVMHCVEPGHGVEVSSMLSGPPSGNCSPSPLYGGRAVRLLANWEMDPSAVKMKPTPSTVESWVSDVARQVTL